MIDEVPHGLLLRIGHPFHRIFLISVGPIHAVAQNDEQLDMAERLGIERFDILDKRHWNVLAQQRRRQVVADVDRAVIAVADQCQRARAISRCIDFRRVLSEHAGDAQGSSE